MNEMVERVAKAIHNKLYEDSPPEWNDEDWKEMRPQFMGEARAAIEAMREPTPKMRNAACAAMSPEKRPTKKHVGVKRKHTIRYQAMIDAALQGDE